MTEETGLATIDAMPIIADDTLITMANQAEKRIEAVIKIKQTALKVTNSTDWVDQNGRPYLQASGAEKIANLFNISWKIDEPQIETEESGHFTYTYKGVFSLSGRTIEIEGSRSSKDPFFKKYDYVDTGKTYPNGDPIKTKVEKQISDIDRRDVKMAALTNLLANGITRVLGIRNLSYADLEKFAGIRIEDIGKVEYKKQGGGKPPVNPPQKKMQQPPVNTPQNEEKKRTPASVVNELVIAHEGDVDMARERMKKETGKDSSDQLNETDMDKLEIIIGELKGAKNGR